MRGNPPVKQFALPIVLGAVGIAVGVGLASGLADYAVFLTISAVVSAIALLGLGIVTGSAGMIALCQLTFAAIGAWVVCGLNIVNAPGGYVVWLVVGTMAAGAVGVVIGLPALRLRGVNLAVVTLGFAAAADVMFVQVQFPGSVTGTAVVRPPLFADDRSFLVFSVVVLVVCSITVHLLQRSRWGSSWKAVAFSERGTAAVGSSVPAAKLSAFAVSAALGGLSGALLAGQVQLLFASSFTPLQSLAMYVLAIMSGAQLIDMAIFGGILWVLVPELLKRFGVPQDWAFVIFGALGIQSIASGQNLGAGIRHAWWTRRRRGIAVPTTRLTDAAHQLSGGPAREAAVARPVLEVADLTVTFGLVKALNGVNLSIPEAGIMGLIGPNGAGKSTFIDAITGFLPDHGGSVTLDGRPLQGLSPSHRARLGVRRTFQQDRVPPSLTVEAYLRFVARRPLSRKETAETLEFLGCPPARHPAIQRRRGYPSAGGGGGGCARQATLAAAGRTSRRALPRGARGAWPPHHPASGPVRHLGRPDRTRPRHGPRRVSDHHRSRLRRGTRYRAAGRGLGEPGRAEGLHGRDGDAVTELVLTDVSVSRGAGPVIRDVSLRVTAGTVTAVVGPNGAGKTSLLEAISGVIPTSGGSVTLDGESIDKRSRVHRARDGLVHIEQGRTVFPSLTVLENIQLTARDRSDLDAALALFPELERRTHAPAGLLSGGEQQMVVLARAFASRPRCLLIDEMSLGLAPVVFMRLLPIITQIVESGVGVLLVEQFTNIALGLAQDALVVSAGRVTYAGDATTLRESPKLLHTAYLGG